MYISLKLPERLIRGGIKMKKVMRYIILCALLFLLFFALVTYKPTDYKECLAYNKYGEQLSVIIENSSNETIHTDVIVEFPDGSKKKERVNIKGNERVNIDLSEYVDVYNHVDQSIFRFENTVSDFEVTAQGFLISFCCTVILTTVMLIFCEVLSCREERKQQEKSAGG